MKFILLFLTCFLLFSCKTETPYDIFIKEISSYSSFRADLDYLYYNEYKKTNSYVLALNTVNHPDFFKTQSNQVMYDNIILINKLHGVNETYKPNNLVSVQDVPYIKRPNEEMLIDKHVLLNYQVMVEDAKAKGINLVLYSAYRSYEKQLSLWNQVPTFESMYLAVPGYSEHHTGLALDISTYQDGLTNNKNQAYEYLENNAYKFGFILRYPKNKESITGYSYEPWHYRYVGEIAEKIYKENLTLEEYIYNYIAI